MKNHNIFRVVVLIILCCISCSEDKKSDENTVANFYNQPCVKGTGTCLSIIGRFKVIPGKNYTYTASTTISNPTITWEVNSGSMILISSEGSSAVFKFNPDFTTGTIKSRAVSPITTELSECILDISKE